MVKLAVYHQKCFHSFRLRNGCDALYKNMPVTAGSLKWSQELQEASQAQNTFQAHQSSLSIAVKHCTMGLKTLQALSEVIVSLCT